MIKAYILETPEGLIGLNVDNLDEQIRFDQNPKARALTGPEQALFVDGLQEVGGERSTISGASLNDAVLTYDLKTQTQKNYEVAFHEISRLENLETPRRMAEAMLNDTGKAWLQTNRDLIAVERTKLVGL